MNKYEYGGSYQTNYYIKFEDEKELTLKNKKDFSISEIGSFDIETDGEFRTVTRNYHDYKNFGLEKESYTDTICGKNKKLGSIDLYSGCPYKGDGDIPIMINRKQWVQLPYKTLYAYNCSVIGTCHQVFMGCLDIFSCCIEEELGQDVDPVRMGIRDLYFPSTTKISIATNLLSQSLSTDLIEEIAKKGLKFLHVKDGEIQSISDYSTYADSFIVKIGSDGYLTQPLSVSYLSKEEYNSKIDSMLKKLDLNEKYKKEYSKLYK